MCIPVATISAFINDTPVVAVMMPIIDSWALKTGTPVSKLMIPLSYSALLGGMCTLTGTSTNLVLQGLVKQDPNAATDHVTVTMFEMTPVGACVAFSCIVYMAFAARCLLPNRHVDDDDSDAGNGYVTIMQSDFASLQPIANVWGMCQFRIDCIFRAALVEGKRKYVIDVQLTAKSAFREKNIAHTVLNNATILEGSEPDQVLSHCACQQYSAHSSHCFCLRGRGYIFKRS